MYLALFLVALVFFTRYIGSFSTQKATDVIWELWTRLAPSSSIQQLRLKREELTKVRLERSNTSSQGEFAKWARLDREHQRLKKEYDSINTAVSGKRQHLSHFIRIIKFFAATGTRYAVLWYYRKSPVVWLPYEALPVRVEQFVSLPFAPLGSVSVATWTYSVETTIKAFGSLYKSINSLK